MQKSDLVFIIFKVKCFQHIPDNIVDIVFIQVLQRSRGLLLKIMFGVDIFIYINMRMSFEGVVGNYFPPPPI